MPQVNVRLTQNRFMFTKQLQRLLKNMKHYWKQRHSEQTKHFTQCCEWWCDHWVCCVVFSFEGDNIAYKVTVVNTGNKFSPETVWSNHTYILYIMYWYDYVSVISLLHFSHSWSNWSPPSFSSNTLPNFYSIFQIVQVSAPYKAMIQMLHFTSSFLRFHPKWLLLLNAAFVMDILGLISHSLSGYQDYLNIPHSPDAYILYWGWLPWSSLYLSFFPIHLHSMASSNFD